MFVRTLDLLCLRVLGSPALGRGVRAVIVGAARQTPPRTETADGRPGTMVPVC